MPKRIVIVAGEESGDQHAAKLVHSLLTLDPSLQISGIGGKHMLEAGVDLLCDLAQFGVTGLTEILRHALVIKKAFTNISKHLAELKPDLVILVDYPGFNLRLAKVAKRLGLRVLYYISPQVWAWKASRIKTIKACVDHMAVILPFEKKIYQDAEVPVSFVGHPLVGTLPMYDDVTLLRQELQLPQDKQLLALLPGSRRNEIDNHLPVLLQTAQDLVLKHPKLHLVLPIAASLKPEMVTDYFKGVTLPISFISGQAVKVVAASDAVIVASGTASLECALLQKPMCIIYKANTLSYLVASKVMKVRYLGLCNILQDKMIVPELLQYDCNREELAKVVDGLLGDDTIKAQLQSRLSKLHKSLSAERADCTLTELVMRELT